MGFLTYNTYREATAGEGHRYTYAATEVSTNAGVGYARTISRETSATLLGDTTAVLRFSTGRTCVTDCDVRDTGSVRYEETYGANVNHLGATYATTARTLSTNSTGGTSSASSTSSYSTTHHSALTQRTVTESCMTTAAVAATVTYATTSSRAVPAAAAGGGTTTTAQYFATTATTAGTTTRNVPDISTRTESIPSWWGWRSERGTAILATNNLGTGDCPVWLPGATAGLVPLWDYERNSSGRTTLWPEAVGASTCAGFSQNELRQDTAATAAVPAQTYTYATPSNVTTVVVTAGTFVSPFGAKRVPPATQGGIASTTTTVAPQTLTVTLLPGFTYRTFLGTTTVTAETVVTTTADTVLPLGAGPSPVDRFNYQLGTCNTSITTVQTVTLTVPVLRLQDTGDRPAWHRFGAIAEATGEYSTDGFAVRSSLSEGCIVQTAIAVKHLGDVGVAYTFLGQTGEARSVAYAPVAFAQGFSPWGNAATYRDVFIAGGAPATSIFGSFPFLPAMIGRTSNAAATTSWGVWAPWGNPVTARSGDDTVVAHLRWAYATTAANRTYGFTVQLPASADTATTVAEIPFTLHGETLSTYASVLGVSTVRATRTVTGTSALTLQFLDRVTDTFCEHAGVLARGEIRGIGGRPKATGGVSAMLWGAYEIVPQTGASFRAVFPEPVMLVCGDCYTGSGRAEATDGPLPRVTLTLPGQVSIRGVDLARFATYATTGDGTSPVLPTGALRGTPWWPAEAFAAR